MRSPRSYNDSSSMLAGLAPWSQTGLSSSSQSSSVTCAVHIQRHQTGVLCSLHTRKKTAKMSEHVGTVTGMTRCKMATAGVPKQFWLFALSTAIYLKNRSIHSAHSKTPFEMFQGRKPDLSHLHLFGCQSFVLKEVRKKLDSKARNAILLGYSGNSKGYVVASTDGSETRAPKVWVSRNVNFNDDAFPYRRGSAVTQGERG